MRGSSFLCALFVLFSAIPVSVQAQSFAERLPDATTGSLGALHEEFNIPRGDVDLDGVASFADFLVISMNYELPGEDYGYSDGDINLDGSVDLADFAMHTFNFGQENFRPDPPSRPPNGNLGLSRNDDGFLTVSSAEPVGVGAFEIVSEFGGLSGNAEVASPFIFFLSNTNNRVTIASLSEELSPILDGDYPTFHTSSTDDVEIRWIEPDSYEVYSLPMGDGDALVGRLTPGYTKPWVPPTPIPRQTFEELDAAEDLESLLLIHQEQSIPRGELDGFGIVDDGDLFELEINWGRTVSNYSDGDLNLDGTVGLDDLAIFAANFGQTEWAEDSDRVVEEPADLSLSIDEFGVLQLDSDRVVELGGIELTTTTASDSFLRTWQTDPFEQLAVNEPDVYVAASFFSPVTLSDDVVLRGARLVPDMEHEVTLRWFEAGSYSVFESGPFSLQFEADRSFGDVDGNGVVEFADFLTLANTYGHIVEPSTGADITGDGRVNFYDFLILSHNFGLDAPRAAQVPEPAFGFRFGMLIVSLWFCSFRKRRGL